jgi:hypothetical protein
MTNAIPIRIADAVTAEINGQSFSIGEFTAYRSYADWDDKFEDLTTMAVDVVYVTRDTEIGLDSRGFIGYVCSVDIAVRKVFGPTDREGNESNRAGRLKNTSVDPLVTLLEQIHEYFVGERANVVLDDETEANWLESDVKSWVNQRKLRDGLFEGVVRIKFSLRKAI